MKSLLRILTRYIISAVFIVLLIITINLVFAGTFLVRFNMSNNGEARISQIAHQIIEADSNISISKQGEKMLKRYRFGMLLNDNGQVIWSYQLPQNLNHDYSVGEVASFSKWYLEGYPVFVWNCDEGLLVLATEKDTYWKNQALMPLNTLNRMLDWIPAFFMFNIAAIIILCLFFGYGFYRSLKPVINGIEDLSDQKEIHLKEKGMTKELRQKLNLTSGVLKRQRHLIERRDEARTEWIAGVSHDIRTPLAIILGYSEQLEKNTNLSKEEKEQLQAVEKQGQKIKKLIEDLNLTSKLEYGMQPLRIESYKPTGLIRAIVTSYYNQGVIDTHPIHLEIEPSAEAVALNGDVNLLQRAFENIIGNSIRHNPKGCQIDITVTKDETQDSAVQFVIQDDGIGIPDEVIQILMGVQEVTQEEQPHIMGLRIVSQIVKAHRGSIEFVSGEEGTRIDIHLSKMSVE